MIGSFAPVAATKLLALESINHLRARACVMWCLKVYGAYRKEAEYVKRSKLTNDMRVLIKSRPSDITTRVVLGVRYGTICDDKKHAGRGHLLEHILLKDHAAEVESLGGYLTGSIFTDCVILFLQIWPEELKNTMAILSDITFNLSLSSKILDNEKNIVTQELMMHFDDPAWYSHQLLRTALYHKHPNGYTLFDELDSLETISEKDVDKAHKEYFVPNNIVLGLFGNLTEEKDAYENIRTIFESHNRGKVPNFRRYTEQAKPFKKKNVEQRKGLNQTHLWKGTKTLPRSVDRDSIALDLCQVILGAGFNSRLNMKIREKRGLAYTVNANHSQGIDWGRFSVYTAVKERNVNKVLEIISKELLKFREQRVGKEELVRAKNIVRRDIALALDDPFSSAQMLLKAEMLFGNSNLIHKYICNIDSITAADIMEIADKYFVEDNFATGILHP